MRAQDRKIFLRNMEVSNEAKLLWCMLETWADKNGVAWPSTTRLILLTRWHRDTLFKYLKELRKSGHLEVTKKKSKNGFQRNEYKLVVRPKSSDVRASGNLGHYTSPAEGKKRSKSLAVESKDILRVLPDPEVDQRASG